MGINDQKQTCDNAFYFNSTCDTEAPKRHYNFRKQNAQDIMNDQSYLKLTAV